jgi:hypothetical protein
VGSASHPPGSPVTLIHQPVAILKFRSLRCTLCFVWYRVPLRSRSMCICKLQPNHAVNTARWQSFAPAAVGRLP